MSKLTLVIRNISQLSLNEIDDILKLAGMDKLTVNECRESSLIAQFKEYIQEQDKVGIRHLLKESVIRDFLYGRIKLLSGADVILHSDETAGKSETNYIISKLHNIKADTHINLLFIGGGHGGYEGLSTVKLLSGLTMESVAEIADELKKKSVTLDGGILHSCSSAMFTAFFRPFLKENGVLFSYSAELGASSNWDMTVAWLLDPNYSPFYSADAMAKPWESGDLGTTTSVISTKYINQFIDLDNSNAGLPDFVDASDESSFQRELVMELFLGEKGIHSNRETDVDKFNDVIAMEQFNEYFNLALKANESVDDMQTHVAAPK